MPSFLEQFKSLLQLPLQTGKKLLSQSRAKGLQVRAAPQLPGGGEQIDISESETITPTGPVVPAVLGTPAAVAPQPGVAPTPAAPTVGMAGGVPTVPGGAEDAGLGGITPEALAQFRELMGQQQTPEMLEQKRKSQELLEQLIPFRQQLAQAEAPTEAMVQLDAQITGLKRQIAQTTPEAFESTLGRTKGFAAAMAAKQRAPVQAEVSELLFQRSVLGQKKLQEAQQAQAGITALESEFGIRQAMAKLGQPAELPAGIQTELFKRAFPAPVEDKVVSVSDASRLGVPYGTTQQEALALKITPKQAAAMRPEDMLNIELKLAANFNRNTKEAKDAQTQIGLMKTSLEFAQRGGDLNAASQGVLVTFQKLLDPSSVVRESEYARSGAGLSLVGRIEGMAEKIQKGGAGVTLEGLEEFVNLGMEFYKNYGNTLLEHAQLIERQAKRVPGIDVENILVQSDLDLLRRGVTVEGEVSEEVDITDLDFTF
jgi:hypothetical protein